MNIEILAKRNTNTGLVNPPDDPVFKPRNKIRGGKYEQDVVELMYQERPLEQIQDHLWIKFQYKAGYDCLSAYRDQYFIPAFREGLSPAALVLKRAESAIAIDQKLKERAFTDSLNRTDQLRQDIRILDSMIGSIYNEKTHDDLLKKPRQQMSLMKLIESRDELHGKLNAEINNPNSFASMKLEIMKAVAGKAISRFIPHVPKEKAKKLLEEFKQDIRYI